MEVEIGSHPVSPEFRRRCSPRPGQLEQTEQVSLACAGIWSITQTGRCARLQQRLRGPRALKHKLPLIPDWVFDASLVLNKMDRNALKRVLWHAGNPFAYSSCSPLAGAAMPKKTKTARFNRTISSSARRPTRAPIFAFGTVVILSTINRQTARSPLPWLGSRGSRNRGASVGSVVKAHTVMESVLSKRSSWRITAGRGFPA